MILSDFLCPYHGRFEALAESEADSMPCPVDLPPATGRDCVVCGATSPWSPSPVRGRVRLAEVERGGVEQAASPMYLNTRALGEGQPYDEWRADRDKVYAERRHKEGRDL